MSRFKVFFIGLVLIIFNGFIPLSVASAADLQTTDYSLSETNSDKNDYIPVKAIPINSNYQPSIQPISVPKTNLALSPALYSSGSAYITYHSWGRTQLGLTNDGQEKVALYDLFSSTFQNASSIVGKQYPDDPEYYIMYAISLGSMTLTVDDAIAAYSIFKDDHPEYYWLYNGILYDGDNYAKTLYIVTTSDYDTPTERASCDTIISNKVAEYHKAISNQTSDYEIAKAIHDKMITDIDYLYDSKGYPSEELYAHNIEGILDGKGGVCEGYAKTYQYLLNSFGVPNIYVTGLAGSGIDYEGHAWNLVMSDNEYFYDVDVTWDDESTSPLYDYFMKGSVVFEADHIPDRPEGIGFDYLYPLPYVPTQDYSLNSSKGVSISSMTCTLSETAMTYDGTQKKPTVTINGLTEGTDFNVYYSNNVNAGTATVIVSGIGTYTGTLTNTFTINKADLTGIASAKMTLSATSFTYNKKAITPSVSIPGLIKDTDYTTSYSNNVNIGTASVTVTGIGNYTGTFSKTFTIYFGTPSIKAIAGTKKATITWSKVAGASGYEVYISTTATGKYTMIKTVSSSITGVTKKNLIKRKTYYYKVRAYVMINGRKVYSSYSNIKYTRIK
jgi:Uncharacterized protein involved in cytokinesis, contains TGc (transglutaminase/protease-like) domain